MTDPPASSASADNTLAFPASVAQQAFWYLELLEKSVSAFNVPLRFRIDGPVDPRILQKALGSIAGRHESLRTHFEEDNGELLQIVVAELEFPLPLHDISSLTEEKMGEEADRLGTREAQRSFDLSSGPLLRAELVKFSPVKHHLHLTFHHSVFDGLSIALFISELAEFYEVHLYRREDTLEPLPIQYGDYSVWQKDLLQSPQVAAQLEWWKGNLAGMVEPDLPTDRPRPARKSWKGEIVSTPLSKDLIERLQTIASRNSSTLFHLQLAAFKILLQRYTGSDDISVGTPVSGRTRPEIEPLIGIFINSLILRSDLSGNPSFEKLLGQVRDNALRAIDHQDLPFENLVRELRPNRDPGRNPLFQINFSHDRFAPKPQEFANLVISPVSSRSPGSIFDLHLFITERDGIWRAGCDFSTDLFDRATASRMLGQFRHLLEQIADEPSKAIADLDVLSSPEKDELLGKWASAPTAYPSHLNVPALFADIAARHPDRTALIHGDETFTYRQLAAAATAIARRLSDAGLRQGDLAAIAGPPSPGLIAGILGILMAGGVYVPLNPDDPAERTKLLLEECGARFCIADEEAVAGFDGIRIPFPGMDGDSGSAPLPVIDADASLAAYVMFTSGSTGKPKGVLVPHRAIARLVKNPNFLPIAADDVFLLSAPAAFDASTLEIWGPLLNGAKLVIPDKGKTLDRIAAAVREHGVTTLWLTAGLFNLMIEEHASDLTGLRHLLAGGDVLSVPHVRKALAALPATHLINGYGPTENTTFTTCHRISPRDTERTSIPIGTPVSNSTAYLLDPQGRPVPIGVPGELHTGGDGLALGYHRDADLTAEKFIIHPQLGRLYRTGDLCRWLADGTIEFLGRRDHQVKVRGFRIEPGEIEAVLASHPDIRQSKVAVRGDDAENKRILAWAVPVEGRSPSSDEIASYLSRRLPAFMCPDGIGIIEKFPVTKNGKVDTAALPDLFTTAEAKDKALPVGETETKLATIWAELLGIEGIGRDEEFFSLGGHSLMALRMFSRISREFDRSLPLSALISHPTVRELSQLLKTDSIPPMSSPDTLGKGHLVALSGSGDEPPLFCIHGGDGGVLFYRDLAALLPDNLPVFAIESVELSSSEPIVPSSVEETSASYVKTLLAQYPQGPYRLAGYSFGGVVAHEMACILSGMGHEVRFLGLLDTHNPSATSRRYGSLERIAIFWKQHRHIPLAPRFFKLIGRFREGMATHRRVKNEVLAATTDGPAEAHGDLRRVQVRQENWRAMQAYQPRPFLGKITLFKAKDQSDKVEWPEDYGWRAMGAGGFEIIPVEGKHLTLFESGNVSHLADALKPAIKAASA